MQRYIVTEKATGKELTSFEFTDTDDGVKKLKAYYATGVEPSETYVSIKDDGDLPPVPVAPERLKELLKSRKERKDKGQPREKAEGQAQRVRNRGQFFVFGTYTDGPALNMCTSRETLMAFLEKFTPTVSDLRVIQGHELKVEHQFTLKPVKPC